MSTVKVNTVIPDVTGQDITIGGSGDTVTVAGTAANSTVKTSSIVDAGGNMIFDVASGVPSNLNAGFKGGVVLLNTTTASSDANVTFTSSITGAWSSYKTYMIKATNIVNGSDATHLHMNVTSAAQPSGDVGPSSSWSNENDYAAGAGGSWSYRTGQDTDNSGTNPMLQFYGGNVGYEGYSGEIYFFLPDSTTFTKHWWSRFVLNRSDLYITDQYSAGYYNFTTTIVGIKLYPSSGTFSGVFKLYGLG